MPTHHPMTHRPQYLTGACSSRQQHPVDQVVVERARIVIEYDALHLTPVWNDGGTAKVRKADATTAGKEAHGFVLSAVTSGNPATVYFEGTNTQVTGQTPGPVYLQTTAGAGGTTIPSASGNVVQQVGVAVSATAVNFERATPVVLA